MDAYRRLRQRVVEGPPTDPSLLAGLNHLLEEEETHWRILTDAAGGRLAMEELERLLEEHRFAGMQNIRKLDAAAQDLWAGELSVALAQEEKTTMFYGNLQRLSKIPVVKKAFQLLAGMEREHVDILKRLLGREPPESEPR